MALYEGFVKDPEMGMTMKEMREAWSHAEGGKKIPMKKVEEAFSHGDQNDNGRLSLDEFRRLVEEGAKEEEQKNKKEDHSEARKHWD
jgi:Ca2+-binding EF-hand superfamily protein